MGSSTLSAVSSGPLAPLAAEPGLFDPTVPPERQEGSCVWGVDCSSKRVAVAVDGAPPRTWVKSFTYYEETGLRLGAIYAETVGLAREVARETGLPDLVVVEQPTGKTPAPVLMYATGVEIAALATLGVSVRLIAVMTWKQRAVGHGHAKKPQIMEWARRRGYTGRLEDEADALGIAVGGRSLFGVG
jgi:hypothetical protein